jgi:hypothetical protein
MIRTYFEPLVGGAQCMADAVRSETYGDEEQRGVDDIEQQQRLSDPLRATLTQEPTVEFDDDEDKDEDE